MPASRPRPANTDSVITRLTVELTRPIPGGGPLALSTVVERFGRKVSVVAVSLPADGSEVAKVRSIRVRRVHLDLPEHLLANPERARLLKVVTSGWRGPPMAPRSRSTATAPNVTES